MQGKRFKADETKVRISNFLLLFFIKIVILVLIFVALTETVLDMLYLNPIRARGGGFYVFLEILLIITP